MFQIVLNRSRRLGVRLSFIWRLGLTVMQAFIILFFYSAMEFDNDWPLTVLHVLWAYFMRDVNVWGWNIQVRIVFDGPTYQFSTIFLGLFLRECWAVYDYCISSFILVCHITGSQDGYLFPFFFFLLFYLSVSSLFLFFSFSDLCSHFFFLFFY